jgi:hypothetical protein
MTLEGGVNLGNEVGAVDVGIAGSVSVAAGGV